MLNVKMIGVVMLFPGMVTVVEGVIVILGPGAPILSFVQVQNVPPSEALFKAKVLLPGPPAS